MGFTKETAAEHGRKGGNKTKERLVFDPDYFSRNGRLAGKKVKKLYPNQFSEMGKKSQEARRNKL